MVRWRYDDPPLVWLLVGAYAAHLVEELVGGFPNWLGTVIGRPLAGRDFLIINAVGVGAMIVAAYLSATRATLRWLAVGMATVLLVNGLLHLAGSLATGTYSPGLITGIVLYVPLGQLVLLRASDQAPRAFVWRGVLAGLAAHAAVTLTAFGAAYR